MSRFVEPVDYRLEFDAKDTVLTLHFLLPLKAPVKAKTLELEVFDPSYFVDFSLAEKDAGEPGEGAGRLPAQSRQAAGNDQGDGAEAGRDSAGRAKFRITATGRRSPTRYR